MTACHAKPAPEGENNFYKGNSNILSLAYTKHVESLRFSVIFNTYGNF